MPLAVSLAERSNSIPQSILSRIVTVVYCLHQTIFLFHFSKLIPRSGRIPNFFFDPISFSLFRIFSSPRSGRKRTFSISKSIANFFVFVFAKFSFRKVNYPYCFRGIDLHKLQTVSYSSTRCKVLLDSVQLTYIRKRSHRYIFISVCPFLSHSVSLSPGVSLSLCDENITIFHARSPSFPLHLDDVVFCGYTKILCTVDVGSLFTLNFYVTNISHFQRISMATVVRVHDYTRTVFVSFAERELSFRSFYYQQLHRIESCRVGQIVKL